MVTKTNEVTLTEGSLSLFLWYAKDASNWGGAPWLDGNRDFTREDRGYLTQLKKAGLLTTTREGSGEFIVFTPSGISLAGEHGIVIVG